MTGLFCLWKRNWRIAESRLLFLALLVSVTAVSSVTFFTDRTDQAMRQQASKIMGGDLVVQSTRPISASYQEQAALLGIRTAEITSFPSMVLVNDQSQLVQIKAASSSYPLFGELSIADALDDQGTVTAFAALQSSQGWAVPHVFVALGIQPGTKVALGQSEIELSGVISQSPDQGASAFEFMPQLLMPLEDIKATGLLTPASRAKFSVLFAGSPKQIKALRVWLKPQLQPFEKIKSLEDGLPSIQQALKRGQKFLSLASLLSVILAGVAIALTSYSLSQRETNTVAILKTLGASRRQIMARYATQLFLLATLAALLGIAIGFLLQYALAFILRDLIGQSLPASSFIPVLSGLLTAWVMVMGFSLPQLIRLINISPVSIFQRTASNHPKISKKIIIPALAIALGTLVLIWLQVHEVILSIVLLLGLIVIIGCFWLVSILLLRLLQGINQKMSQRILPALPLPKANFRIALLMMVFGIGFFSLLLLTALRTDLINRWQATLPDDAPNYFLINIQPNEVESLNDYFQRQPSRSTSTSAVKALPVLYPMIRGRLTKINDKAVKAEDFNSRRARGLLDREVNISTTTQLTEGNTLTEGRWFQPDDTAGLSIEEGIAKVLKLKLGDTMTFDIAGQPFKQAITSFRTVRWDNMQPNFFILAAPQALQDKPRTFMSSLYVDQQDRRFIPELIKLHPSISAIDISTILSKIKELITKAAFAVQTIFVFTLLSGIAVLFAALQSQKAERRKEIAILKSMGARHSYLRKSIITEFVFIGAIAGFIAAFFAMLVSNLLAYQLFDLTPAINPVLLLAGIVGGAVLVGVGGYMNLRGLFQVAPRVLFQE